MGSCHCGPGTDRDLGSRSVGFGFSPAHLGLKDDTTVYPLGCTDAPRASEDTNSSHVGLVGGLTWQVV